MTMSFTAFLLLNLAKDSPVLLAAQLQLTPTVCVNFQLLQLTLVISFLVFVIPSLLILCRCLVVPVRKLGCLYFAILLLVQGQGHQSC